MHSLLNVSNLTITFGMQKVIDNVSFSLFEGQYLAVIGPNGSGKSTLVKAIIKEIKRYHGSISIDRHVTCGYMSQQNQDGEFFPATAYEIVVSGFSKKLFNFWLSKEEKIHLSSVIEELGIKDLMDRSFFSLSGGQKRIILMARALCASPEILILDEPEAGLDCRTREKIYSLIRHVNKFYKVAILIVCHDISRICKESDSVLCLEHKVKYLGNSKKFIESAIFRELSEHSV